MTEQVVKSKDLRRQTKEWMAVFSQTVWEISYRKNCKYMRNNSTKQKGKKISTTHYRSKFRVQRYGDKLPKKVGKHWRAKCGAPFVQAWCQKDLPTLYQSEDRPVNSRDVNPLETIWIIVDETIYKDPAPKTLDELRQWLRFAWKNVTLDTLWELVHSIPHSLIRKCQKTYRKTFWLLIFQVLNDKWIMNNTLSFTKGFC